MMRETNVRAWLRERAALPIYFEKLSGNHGDTLIQLGARHVFSKLNLTLVDDPERAQLIFVNGGGAMNEIWGHGLRMVSELRARHPQTPLCIGPSTFDFETFDFRTLIGQGRAPMTVFCRERTSAALLMPFASRGELDLHLDHDLAFQLRDSSFLEGARARRAEEHLLVAMRTDLEGRGATIGRLRAPFLPRALRRRLADLRDRFVARGASSIIDGELARLEVAEPGRVITNDISRTGSFEDFVELVARATAVVTDRLHVAILSALLEKRCSLSAGRYHKNRSVYEMSLADGASSVVWAE